MLRTISRFVRTISRFVGRHDDHDHGGTAGAGAASASYTYTPEECGSAGDDSYDDGAPKTSSTSGMDMGRGGGRGRGRGWMPPSEIDCKHGPACTYPNCKFKHPGGPNQQGPPHQEWGNAPGANHDDGASATSSTSGVGRGRGGGRGRGRGWVPPSEIDCKHRPACTYPNCKFKHPAGRNLDGASSSRDGKAKNVAIVKSKILGPSLVNKMCIYYGDDLARLEEEVGASVTYLEAECRLKTTVADADARRVETIFDKAIEYTRSKLALEHNEFHLVGSTRAVVRAGMEISHVLTGSEFRSLEAIQVPNTNGTVSEDTKNQIIRAFHKYTTNEPYLYDTVWGEKSKLRIVFSKSEEAQAALEGNPKGPWKTLWPFFNRPREGTMVQVLKIKVKYPLNPKPKRDPRFILLDQLGARFGVKIQDIIIRYKPHKGTGSAYVSLPSKAAAEAAEAQLRTLASIPNELTSQPDNLTIKKDVSFEVAVGGREFAALRPLLENLQRQFASVSIQLKEPKPPSRWVAVIKCARKSGTGPFSAAEKESLIKARSEIEGVLCGRVLRFSRDEMQFMRSEKMKQEIEEIKRDENERAPGSLFIRVEKESSKIRLFGAPPVTKNAEDTIHGLKFSLFEEHPRELEVSSATRAYLLSGKEDSLPELRDSLQVELDQELKLKVEKATESGDGNATVRVLGTHEAVLKAGEILKDLHKIASSGQTMKIRSCGGPNPSHICSISKSPIEPKKRHIMEPCLHAYDKEKAKTQLINSLESKKIPITCGSAGCKPPRPCGLEDCKMLLSNTEFEKGLRQSLMHYLARHASQLGRCPSEGCPQVYRVGPALYECSYCLEAYCTHCHDKWHEGKTCEEYQSGLRANSASAQWVAENTKPCGNCKAPFFKRSGCNHLVCGNCKKHLCNKCAATFETALETYQHLRTAHNGLYD